MINFFNYYSSIEEPLKRQQLRNKIISECKIQLPSFYSWIRRKKVPPLAQEKIANILEKPQSELFPETENEFNY
jgi:hypothetical protein